ncbi:unnamed protein product [Cylindrotheca closterium]|uniref:Uncharacterized protein n=1 Tax=Cylindrotheca closterium TaxID=2856 RepID=A0AAD2FVK9_9STRA|nr:unnamed protein product [Cylindrotheca closterium]
MTQTATAATTTTANDAAMEKKAHKALFRSQVMSGTTPIQLKAKAIRSKMILSNAPGAGGKVAATSNGQKLPSLFKETNFQYLGDTVIIWNLKEYLDHPKWKEDALRRSLKRRQREESLAMSSASNSKSCISLQGGGGLNSKNRKKRFRAVVEALYQKSLAENKTAAIPGKSN